MPTKKIRMGVTVTCDSQANMKDSLSRLPVELIDSITCRIEPIDLLSLRLMCKTLNDRVAQLFAETWFTTLKTDLGPNSLRRLNEISHAEHLRTYPRTLAIVFREDCYGTGSLGRGFSWPRYSGEGRLKDLQQHPAVQILQDTLVNRLTKCRSFRTCNGPTLHEYNDQDPFYKSDIVEIILSIVAETGLPIESLWLDFGGQWMDVNRLNLQLYRQPKFQKAWTGIQELHLEHSFSVSSELFDFMMYLLTHAPNLRTLSLRFNFDRAEDFVTQLFGSGQAPSRLETFKLASSYVPDDVVLNLLRPSSSSLRSLSFVGMYLPSRSPGWPKFLTAIKDTLPHLDSISIERPRQYRGKPDRSLGEIVFPALTELPALRPRVPGKFADQWTAFHGLPSDNLEAGGDGVERQREGGPEGGGTFVLFHRHFRKQQRVWAIAYEGPRMAEALELIGRSIDFVNLDG